MIYIAMAVYGIIAWIVGCVAIYNKEFKHATGAALFGLWWPGWLVFFLMFIVISAPLIFIRDQVEIEIGLPNNAITRTIKYFALAILSLLFFLSIAGSIFTEGR